MEKIIIDKAIYDFLNGSLFGTSHVTFETASYRAYRDLCRTLRLNGKDSTPLTDKIDALLEERITDLLNNGPYTQEAFDTWHETLCKDISACAEELDIELSVGQAQKWLNMTMKYLYIQMYPEIDKLMDLCHVPIDSYIIAAANKEFGIKQPSKPWSRINDYNEYMRFQKQIREKVETTPIQWEFRAWQSAVNSLK